VKQGLSGGTGPKPQVSRGIIIKNAIANLASGSSGALLAIVLPPILLRYLSREAYAIWTLVLQVGTYTGFLTFGVQVAVGRYVAHYESTGEEQRRDELISTAWVGLLLASGIALAGVAAVSYGFPHLFPKTPEALKAESRIAMAWVGGSLAIGLPASVLMGVLNGRQRYEIPGLIQIAGRFMTGVALALMAASSKSLVPMAKAYALVNLVTYLLQYFAFRTLARDIKIKVMAACRNAARELWDYCFSLTVWNVAMLMVSGLDLMIVGRVDFRSVPAYGIATSLVALVAGLQNAVFSVLIPAGAILGAKKDEEGLRRMFLRSTRIGVLMLMGSGLPLIFGGGFLIKHYLGAGWVQGTHPLLVLLVIGNMIRLTATPYAVLLIGTGQQRIILLTPLVEGLANLTLSITLGRLMGAPGVAIGTIAGSCIGILCNLFFNFPRTRMIVPGAWEYVKEGFASPVAAMAPVIVVGVLLQVFHPRMTVQFAGMGTALALSLVFVWMFGLGTEGKNYIHSFILRWRARC